MDSSNALCAIVSIMALVKKDGLSPGFTRKAEGAVVTALGDGGWMKEGGGKVRRRGSKNGRRYVQGRKDN